MSKAFRPDPLGEGNEFGGYPAVVSPGEFVGAEEPMPDVKNDGEFQDQPLINESYLAHCCVLILNPFFPSVNVFLSMSSTYETLKGQHIWQYLNFFHHFGTFPVGCGSPAPWRENPESRNLRESLQLYAFQ
jgi:hypothetical protein